jgi:hypothetical protein
MFQRSKWLRVLFGASAFACASSAFALPPTVETKLTCQTLPQVVLCKINLETNPGSHLKWAEAEFFEVPAFVRPVRQKASYKNDPMKRPLIYLGLTPSGRGKGELAVTVRGVACPDDGLEACTHVKRVLKATISVPASGK